MVPRADIIAVQRDIALGELMKVFESAGHSRLVVYDDTLDDAGGMVHIRDLVAFMTERAAASAKANTRRKRPFPAGLDLQGRRPLDAAVDDEDRARNPLTCRRRCRCSTCWRRCRRPAFISRS